MVNSELQKGIELQKRAEFASAEKIYCAILEEQPEHPEALHYLGLLRFQQGRLEESMRFLTQSVQIQPLDPSAWSDLGMVQVRTGTLEPALESFTRALALAPDHLDALNNMAHTLRRLGRPEKARSLLDRLVTLTPQSAAALSLLAEVQYMLNDVDGAIVNFQNAIRIDPDRNRTRIGIGDAYESTGRFKQARMQYEAVLRRDPVNSEALARILRLREGDTDTAWIKAATDLADDSNTSEKERVRLNIALAYCLDRRGEYSEAFQRLQLGNDSEARRQPFDADGYTRAVDSLVETLTEDFFKTAENSDIRSERPIFIVGMPRSGTTLTEQILASHSGVAAGGELSALLKVSYKIHQYSESREHYPRGLRTISRIKLRRMAREYLDRLDNVSKDSSRVTDKMPFNFMHIGVIALLFPNARIVHCRRNAIDNCLSCYFTGFADQVGFANRLDTLGRYYVDYDRLMRHWNAVLPQEIYELEYESLVEDTEAQVLSLLNYCGLEWEDACMSFHKTQRGVRTPSRWQVRQPIYKGSVQRWRHYEEQLAPLRDILAPVLSEMPVVDSSSDSQSCS